MTTTIDRAKIPAGGPPPAALSPPEALSDEERREAIKIASSGTDAMRINLRVEHPDGRVVFWNAVDVLEGKGEPLGLLPAADRLLRDGTRQLLAVGEKAHAHHALRFFLTTPFDDDPRHNGLVITCRQSGAVTDVGIEDLLGAAGLACGECANGIDADLARAITQAARRLHAAVKGITNAQLELAVRTFDAATPDGW